MGRFDYGYDEKNRHRSEQRDWSDPDGWQYDLGDEITGYRRDGNGNVNSWNSVGLEYDNNGNRWKVNGAEVYAANNLNQYTAAPNVGTMNYDGNGNLTTAEGWTDSYDAQNWVTQGHRHEPVAALWRRAAVRIRQAAGYSRLAACATRALCSVAPTDIHLYEHAH